MADELDLFGWVGGTVDGKYRIDKVVGRGGFGVVYRAHHLGFDQTVALKCLLLPKALTGPDRERFRETFLAEGRLLHQLSRATTGIVQALDLGAAVSPNKHWTPYLVLEWLEGRPLDRDFAERRAASLGGRDLAEALQLLGSAARALAIAHSQGVAHRDIKPANLFLAQVAGQNVVKVLDFGIAKVMAESESVTRAFEETGASLQAFTARYGAPEQFSRRYGATGPWTDVFALALVFTEALIGRPPLDGTDAAQLFVAAADKDRRPTPRGVGHPDPLPDSVEAVLSRALAVDPRERYPNAGEFWNALEAAARDAGIASEPGHGVGAPAVPHLPSPLPLAPGLLPIGHDAPTSAEVIGVARTELSSSTNIPHGPASSASSAAPRRSFARVLSLGVSCLVLGALGTFAVRSALHETREGERGEPSARPATAARNELPRTANTPSAAAPARASAAPAAAVESATAAPSPSAPAVRSDTSNGSTLVTPPPSPLGGVPQRDIPAGLVADRYVDAFRVLAREGAHGLDFATAWKQCADVGMALCTESQWLHACHAVPELGVTPSWTGSITDEGVVVRGGERCESGSASDPGQRDAARYALCCDRAIAMSTNNLQKQFLSTTAQRVLQVERALNQRNVPALLAAAEPSVVVDDEPKTAIQLKALLESDFRAAPDMVIVNDVCEVSVQAKKVTKRTRRKRKVVYETQGWTAECQQTALESAEVKRRPITYSFSANSKLREIVTKPLE